MTHGQMVASGNFYYILKKRIWQRTGQDQGKTFIFSNKGGRDHQHIEIL